MGFQIEDGTGKGYRVNVNSDNRLAVVSVNQELQHHMSLDFGNAYQIIGTHSLSSSGTNVLLHIKNNDPERYLAVSYMRIQYPGGDGTVDANTYFSFGYGTEYSTGGSTATAVNVNQSSGNVPSIVAYQAGPTVTGTLDELDRWYPDKSMQTFNKHGSVILSLGDTMDWRLVTDQTTGLAYVRVTFMMINRE